VIPDGISEYEQGLRLMAGIQPQARYLLLHGRIGMRPGEPKSLERARYDRGKAPLGWTWVRRPGGDPYPAATLEQAIAHVRSGRLCGHRPMDLGLCALDADEYGDEPPSQVARILSREFGAPCQIARTPKGEHYLLPAPDRRDIDQRRWRLYRRGKLVAAGDWRFNRGYVVTWDPCAWGRAAECDSAEPIDAERVLRLMDAGRDPAPPPAAVLGAPLFDAGQGIPLFLEECLRDPRRACDAGHPSRHETVRQGAYVARRAADEGRIPEHEARSCADRLVANAISAGLAERSAVRMRDRGWHDG